MKLLHYFVFLMLTMFLQGRIDLKSTVCYLLLKFNMHKLLQNMEQQLFAMRFMSIVLSFCLVIAQGCNLTTIQAGITNGIGVIENVVGHCGFEDK